MEGMSEAGVGGEGVCKGAFPLLHDVTLGSSTLPGSNSLPMSLPQIPDPPIIPDPPFIVRYLWVPTNDKSGVVVIAGLRV